MSRLNLRNIKKSNKAIPIEEEDLEFIEIPDYFVEGKDLTFSATVNGDTRSSHFFRNLTLCIIIFGIIYTFCYIIFGSSFSITVKAWLHQLQNAISI